MPVMYLYSATGTDGVKENESSLSNESESRSQRGRGLTEDVQVPQAKNGAFLGQGHVCVDNCIHPFR